MMEKLSENKILRIYTYIVMAFILLGILIIQAAPIILAIAQLIKILH